MSSDSVKKTIGVALGVCAVASIFVSTAAVELKPIQVANKKADMVRNILDVGGFDSESPDFNKVYEEHIKPEIINLKTGAVIPEEKYTKELNPDDFDIKSLADSKTYGEAIPSNEDIAGIKRMPKYMVVYKVIKNGKLSEYILPIYGKGLWSTMYGLLALDKDLHTVKGLTFYDQGETPGLGGEVENPKWRALWVGKQAYDSTGRPILQVIKGKVSPNDPRAKYTIDGLSGATLTTRGVNNLVHFWLGKNGYLPYLENLRGKKHE